MKALDPVRATATAIRATVPGRVGIALRATISVAVPLAIGAALGHPAEGAAASFGGLAALHVPQAPYRYRARVVATIGAGLVAAVLLGGLAAAYGPVAALVAGVVAGVASFACQAAELPPPRELMLIMAVLAATEVTAGAPEAVLRAGLAACGAAFAWLVTMSPALLGRRRTPERRAVAGALGAVADLLDAIGSTAVGPARHLAVNGVRGARAALTQGGLPAGHPLARAGLAAEALLEAALHVDVEATGPLDPGWGVAVRALAPSPSGTDAAPVAEPLPSAGSTVGADLLARAVTGAREATTGIPASRPGLPVWPGVLPQLRAALRRHSVVLPAAARVGIAVSVGVGLGHALGLGHAYWVGLTAAAVLQGSNLTITRRRLVHRVAGTVVGVGLAFGVLGWGPPLWVAVLAAAVFQGLVELVIAAHYGLAVVPITVLALLLFEISTPGTDVGAAIGARLVDTALGAAVALAARHVLWPRATSARLPQVQGRTLRAVTAVLDALWTSDGDAERLAERRRTLQGELAALRAVHADALADTPSAATDTDARWPVSVATEELAVLALSWPPSLGAPAAAEGREFLDCVGALADATATGRPTDVVPPRLPGQPRTSAAGAALAVAVRDSASGTR